MRFTTILRYIVITALLLVNAPSFCQVQPGTYKVMIDTTALTAYDTLMGTDFSSLVIRRKHTFTYKFNRSASCLLWYQADGKWETRKDTLILTDDVSNYIPSIRSSDTNNGKETSIHVVDEDGQSIPHMKVAYRYYNSEDTLVAYTDGDGKIVFKDPFPARVRQKLPGGFIVVDDIEFKIYGYREGKYSPIGNCFINQGTQKECTIVKNTTPVNAIRQTYYQINGKELRFLFVTYDKEDFFPTRHMMGSFSM